MSRFARFDERWPIATFSLAMPFAWLCADHFPPWTAFLSDWLAGAALTLALWALCFTEGWRKVRITRSAMFVAGLSVIPICQWALGEIYFFGDAFVAGLYLIAFAVSIQLGHWARAASYRTLEPLVWSFALTALISTAIAFAQRLSLSIPYLPMARLSRNAQAFANFAQPNQFGTFQVIGCLMTVLLFEWRRLDRLSTCVMLLFLMSGAVLSESRTVVLEVLVAAGWLMMRFKAGSARSSPRHVAVMLTLFVLMTLAIVFAMQALDLPSARPGHAEASAGTRPTHWLTALDALLRSPWTGYGWNQIAVAMSRTAADHAPTGWFVEHSHNLLIDILVWNGILLGSAILFLVSRWFIRLVRQPEQTESTILLGVLLAFGVHSLLEFPLEYAYCLIPLGIIVGAVDLVAHEVTSPVMRRVQVVTVAVTATVTLATVGTDYLNMEECYRELRFKSANIGRNRSVDVPRVFVLTQLREFLMFAKTTAIRSLDRDRLDSMRKVAERYGYAPVLFRYAMATALNGLPEASATALVRICKQQSAVLCDEAKQNWKSLGAGAYPELRVVPFPDVEPRR